MSIYDIKKLDCQPQDKDEIINQLKYINAKECLGRIYNLTSTPYTNGHQEHHRKRYTKSGDRWFEDSYKAKSGVKYYIGCAYSKDA